VRLLFVLIALSCACAREEPRAASGSGSAAVAAIRIVSLTPSATEIVAVLGATDQLVGVDEFSHYPPQVDKLPKVGSFLTPNLEAIVRLKPAFVIVDDIHGRAAGALNDAKIETIECPIHALPDIKKALRTVGTRLGKATEAARVIAELDTSLDTAAARRPAKRPRVLLIIDRASGGVGNLVAAGPGSWLDELLAVVGGENVLAASGVRYPKVSLEEVLRGKPDVIIDVSPAVEEPAGITPWNEVDVPAVKTKRVRGLADQYLRAPSPRVKQALDVLEKALAP
jgi:iron complex transport system substrate-binding protein